MVFFRSMEKASKKGECLDVYSSPSSIQNLHMAMKSKAQCTPMLDQLDWALTVKLKKTRGLQDK